MGRARSARGPPVPPNICPGDSLPPPKAAPTPGRSSPLVCGEEGVLTIESSPCLYPILFLFFFSLKKKQNKTKNKTNLKQKLKRENGASDLRLPLSAPCCLPTAPSLNSVCPAVCHLSVHPHSAATSHQSPLPVGGGGDPRGLQFGPKPENVP